MLNLYVIPSLISAVILSILIVIVLRADIHSRSNQFLAIFTSLLFAWSVLDAIQRATDNEQIAFYAMSGILSIIIFLAPMFLHIAYITPWKKRGAHPAILFLYGISFIILALHLNSPFFLSGMKRFPSGYDMVPGEYTNYLLVYVSITSFIALFILLRRYSYLRSSSVLRTMRYLIAGMSVMVILTVATGALPVIYGDLSQYPLTTVSFSIGAILMICGFTRPFPGIPDARSTSEIKGDIPSGTKEMEKEQAYLEFHDLIESGMAGVIISGREGSDIREELGLKGTPIVQAKDMLAGMGPEEAREALYFAISDAAMDPGNIVLLEALEAFTGRDGMNRLLEDLRRMNLKGYVICAKD